MFDHLIQVNDLQSAFDQYDITDTDLVFVKEQIAGPIETEQCSSQKQSVSISLCKLLQYPCTLYIIIPYKVTF